MADLPGWFGPPQRQLFGWFCLPESGRARLGVLLCPPIGEEEHNAHETFRQLARQLAELGVVTLRFDYHGTGDSMGRWDDPRRVSAWRQSVVDAYEALLATGVSRIAAVGMRLGAALVTEVASTGLAALDAIVLWDPASGTAMLREGQARRPSRTDPPAGTVDTPGYLYSAETVEDMREVDAALVPGGATPADLLVLTRDDRPPPRKLARRFPASATTTWGIAHGQAALLDVPMTDSVLPQQTMDEIIAWLGERMPPTAVPVKAVGADMLQIRGSHDELLAVERVVRLGPLGLFGIRSESAEHEAGPFVVFINVANDRHVGPGRRWVDCSRDWASQGYSVLRMDQSGTGDSPCNPGQPFGRLYAREWLRDLPEALTAAADGRPLVLIGLCSGAYSAMESAFTVEVSAVYAINVILHARVTSRWSALADPARVAARPATRPFIFLAERHERAAALLWRIYRQITVWNAPMATVDSLVRAGTDVVLVMSRNDGRHFRENVYWTWFRSRDLIRSRRYRLLESPAVDHPLMTQEGQSWAVRAIEEDLRARFPQPVPRRQLSRQD